MKTLIQLHVQLNGEEKKINFGLPDTENEYRKMYELRYKVYTENSYIESEKYPLNQEKDKIDAEERTMHFVASVDGEIIGTVRSIQKYPLPTEGYFKFKTPEEIENIPTNKRAEIGRLIAVPFVHKGVYLPRALLFLFLIKAMVLKFTELGYGGGYAFIKEGLERKMEKRKMPLHRIPHDNKNCPKDDALYRYFNQPEDAVIPIYFLTKEFSIYADKMLGNRFIFKRGGDNEYYLRTKLYKIFMKITRTT